MTFFPSGSIGINGVFDRVKEFQILRGGRRELLSGWRVGCRHGGCRRAVAMDLEKTNTEVVNGNRCLDREVKEENDSRGKERGINIK